MAAYCDMKILAFSIITDMVSLEFDDEQCPNHEEIVQVANKKASQAEKLVAHFLQKLNEKKILSA